LRHHSHTREGVSHALQAREQVAGSLRDSSVSNKQTPFDQLKKIQKVQMEQQQQRCA
jgi:hypothetical protein